MEIKFQKFINERKLFNSLFNINPLKELVLEFLEDENITTDDITSDKDKYDIYNIYLKLLDYLKSNKIESKIRTGIAYSYIKNGNKSNDIKIDNYGKIEEYNHFWLEVGKWVVDIFPISERGGSGVIQLFHNNENDILYTQKNPLYSF